MKEKTEMRILVVDDSSTMRYILMTCLHRYGISKANIHAAADGVEAVRLLSTMTFDCVLCDWNMPNCDGMGVLTKMRAMPANERTPFMMVTTEAARDDVIAAIKAGADDYLTKPLTPERLIAKLDSLLA